MESRDTQSRRSIKTGISKENIKMTRIVKRSRKENKPKEGIISRITKKYMDLYQDRLTIKLQGQSGQSPANLQN